VLKPHCNESLVVKIKEDTFASFLNFDPLVLSQKPQLISGSKKFSQFLREQCPVVSETYYPTFWCWESRIQTLLRPFVTAKPRVVYRK